jgi:serine phosphatase RsbU (regulator of sigma subunit)
LYLFSDGYADQFGGPKGKKFMVGQFRSFLAQIHKAPMKEQFRTLDLTIEQWRGNLEQVDDILVVGFRVK